MTKTFIFLSKSQNDEWIDTSFVDTAHKAEMREWRVSRNMNTGEMYGTLLRSEGPDDEFDFAVKLPSKMVHRLMEAL